MLFSVSCLSKEGSSPWASGKLGLLLISAASNLQVDLRLPEDSHKMYFINAINSRDIKEGRQLHDCWRYLKAVR